MPLGIFNSGGGEAPNWWFFATVRDYYAGGGTKFAFSETFMSVWVISESTTRELSAASSTIFYCEASFSYWSEMCMIPEISSSPSFSFCWKTF